MLSGDSPDGCRGKDIVSVDGVRPRAPTGWNGILKPGQMSGPRIDLNPFPNALSEASKLFDPSAEKL